MRFFTTAIALLPLVASTLAARPSEGTYAIVNQVLSPKGEKLAVTFNGGGNAVTLTPYCESSNTQHWKLRNYDASKTTMSVTPVNADKLQAAWGKGDYVTVLPAGNYVWTITENTATAGYVTIQDGGKTVFWGPAEATAGRNVSIGSGTNNEKQRWILHKI